MESKKYNRKTWQDLTESSRNLTTPLIDLRASVRQKIEAELEDTILEVIYRMFAGANAKLSWGVCVASLLIMTVAVWWLTQDNTYLFNDEFSNYLAYGDWENL